MQPNVHSAGVTAPNIINWLQHKNVHEINLSVIRENNDQMEKKKNQQQYRWLYNRL